MEKGKIEYIEPKLIHIAFDICDVITASGTETEEVVPPDIGNMDDAWG